MTTYGISVPVLGVESGPITASSFPALAGAVQALARAAHQQWLAYAQGEPLPNGQIINSRSGTYHRSIQIEQSGDYAWRIFTVLPYAEAIEHGMPARDLKKMLDSSLKVRRSKDGKRYLIIPFRWGTPGTIGFGKNVMPPQVHQFFQGEKPSSQTGMGARVSATGASDIRTRQPFLVPQARYEWGARLTQKHLGAMGIGTQFGGKTYKTHPMAGMVNMRQPGASGGSSHSSYLTFRIMSEGSSGWKAPAVPGKYPAKAVADKIRPIAEQAIKRAFEDDLKRVLESLGP